MTHAVDRIHGYPIIPVEVTHQLRIVTGSQAGVVLPLGFERIRLGRPHQDYPGQLWLPLEVAGKVGRCLFVMKEGPGHRIVILGTGLRPVIDGIEVDNQGTVLREGDLIRVGTVELIYERVRSADTEREDD